MFAVTKNYKLISMVNRNRHTTKLAKYKCWQSHKPRLEPRCRVLPPGELKGMIPELLVVNAESFVTTAATVYRNIDQGRIQGRHVSPQRPK